MLKDPPRTFAAHVGQAALELLSLWPHVADPADVDVGGVRCGKGGSMGNARV